MYYTDDPLRDFNEWDNKQQKWLETLPKCNSCKEPIQDEYLYEIDGEVLCESCVNSFYRKNVEDYVED